MRLYSENRTEQLTGIALILLGILFRLLPHPDNFTPVTAIALFSGVVLSRRVAMTLPLIIMISSDLLIGPHPLFWLVWGCFFLVTCAGTWLSRKASAARIFIGTVSGSVFFFIVTNLGVFLFQDLYPKTWAGFIQCYFMALPFFRNALAGDLFYAAVLFGVFAGIKQTLAKPVLQR